MRSIYKMLVGLLLASSLCLCGCQDQAMYKQQIKEVSEYNTAVDNTRILFEENEKIAKDSEDIIVKAITCNEITKEGFSLFNIKDKPARNDGETDEHYMYRCIDTLCGSSFIRPFEEYHKFVNNISSFSDSNGEFIYKYGHVYSIERGCYASIDSNYLCQFLVIANDSGTSLKCRVFWEHGKVQMIVIQ